MIHLFDRFISGNFRQVFLGLNIVVQLEDFRMQRPQEFGEFIPLGLEQLHLLRCLEQIKLRSCQAREHFLSRSFVGQGFSRPGCFGMGFRFDPLLGL